MPHYTCVACQVRLHVSGSTAEPVGECCPECGSLLVPVAELSELFGYRSIEKSSDRRAAGDAQRFGSHQQIADLLDEFVTRRTAILERDRFDPERWLDDSDGPVAVAVAMLPPETYP
jgi:hypothetical protein